MTIPTLRGIWGTRHRNRIIIWVSPGWANAARSWASFPWPIWDLNALIAAASHLTVLYILIWTKNQERFRESWLELLKDNIWRPMLIYQTNLSWLYSSSLEQSIPLTLLCHGVCFFTVSLHFPPALFNPWYLTSSPLSFSHSHFSSRPVLFPPIFCLWPSLSTLYLHTS